MYMFWLKFHPQHPFEYFLWICT
ncbi:hypothetical protein F383_14871 [Gossypium arboreum]|uniref:Uncharacterized protein n=1 Tax=Gossypium arboreum TaxID=29729 RepID=A0A0B0NFN3_GOSAR|nr:hypothetical protein F383_14871 [Gossypium arboreum]